MEFFSVLGGVTLFVRILRTHKCCRVFCAAVLSLEGSLSLIIGLSGCKRGEWERVNGAELPGSAGASPRARHLAF